MLAYLSATGLGQYLHGVNAPIWRALVTLDNSLWLNAAAAVVTALALGFALGRFVQSARRERLPLVGWRVALAFFCVPQFVRTITGLSPAMVSFVPIALALAALMLPSGRKDQDEGKGGRGGWRMLLSGAFAAVAAWEGTLGVAFVPLILLATWLPEVSRGLSLFRAMTFWLIGFIAALVAEGLCLGFEFRVLKPTLPPFFGLVIFAFIGVVPALAVLRLGWKRWLAWTWAGVLAVFLTISLTGGFCTAESGCERFAKTVLADLGERKLIIGDGFTDDFLAVLKPADVRLLNAYSDADREFLLNAFEGGESVTNKVLVVRNYHGLPEMAEVAEELRLRCHKLEKKGKTDVRAKALPETNAVPVAVVMSNAVSQISQRARPLMEQVGAAEAEFAKPQAKRNRETIEKARETVRRELRAHAFGGTRLSNVLIMSDLMLGDTKAAASDAIAVLMSDREDPAANAALGAIRQEEGKFDLAERYLRKGVKGGGMFSMGKLAILLIQTGRSEEAVEWARKAVKKCPGDTSLREPLAAALIEGGRFDEAEAELKEIARLAKEDGTLEREKAFLTGARRRLAVKRKR